MASRVAPGRHILFDAFVVRDDFKNLTQRQLLNFFQGHNNRHRAKVPERIELHIGMWHSVSFLWFVWFIWSLWFFWFNEKNKTNQTNQMN